MWKKPMVKEPEFSSKAFEELKKEQSMDISGGSVGTCYVLGYTCWSQGGFKVGTCLGIGYACNTKKGGF